MTRDMRLYIEDILDLKDQLSRVRREMNSS